jgi:DNA methylase
MTDNKKTIAEQRLYSILDVQSAKKVASVWLEGAELENAIDFGLPEIDDRYHVWRVPLLAKANGERLGEVVIDARNSLILEGKSTNPATLEARLLGRQEKPILIRRAPAKPNGKYALSDLRNTVAAGDCEKILQELPAASIDLVFTSPPYYNARPEYADYLTYEEYLLKLRKVIHNTHRVLAEGRFFVINIAPVLIRRANRTEASRRMPCLLMCISCLCRRVSSLWKILFGRNPKALAGPPVAGGALRQIEIRCNIRPSLLPNIFLFTAKKPQN